MTDEATHYLRKRAQQERDMAVKRDGEAFIADAHRAAAEEYDRHADGIDEAAKDPLPHE